MNRSELRVAVSEYLQTQAAKPGASLALRKVGEGLDNKTLGLRQKTFYIAGKISGNDQEIFKQIGDQVARVGLTNFDGKKLAQGVAVFTHATLFYAKTTTGGADVRVAEFNKTAIDKHILNGDVTFKCDRDVVFEEPIHYLHNPNTTRTNEELFVELSDMPIVEENKNLAFDVILPEGGGAIDATADVEHWVKLVVKAFVTYEK